MKCSTARLEVGVSVAHLGGNLDDSAGSNLAFRREPGYYMGAGSAGRQ